MKAFVRALVSDTNAGFLQWLGAAESHADAIRAHLSDVGPGDVEHEFLVIDLTDSQAAALSDWWDAGASSPDYPEGLPSGVVYDASKVATIMGNADQNRIQIRIEDDDDDDVNAPHNLHMRTER